MADRGVTSTVEDSSSEREEIPANNYWEGKQISEEIANIAEENLRENGIHYIDKVGLYYNSNHRCYYSPYTKLYYYVDHGAYYFYDEESETLQLYSQVTKEVSDSYKDLISNQWSLEDEDAAEKILTAPCLRMTTKSSGSPEVRLGSTFIVTYYGASLGRDVSGRLEISLPDKLISKLHSKFHCIFSTGEYKYVIEDTGSTNGTYLDGERIEPKILAPLRHGSTVTVGTTELLCHIHHMYDVCSDCSFAGLDEDEDSYQKLTKNITEIHKSELMYLKKKFGLKNFIPTNFPQKYVDKAQERRNIKGSSCEHEKTASTSIDVPIHQDNKGYMLLKKMGWEENKTLGKNVYI